MTRAAALRRGGQTAALRLFRAAPAPLRRALVRAGTPSFTVGAVCAVDHDGLLLVLRQPHRHGWSLPGGLLDRGEGAVAGVARELREEVGLHLEPGAPVTAVVDARARRVDVVFRVRVPARPAVRVGGEARTSAWLAPEEVTTDADGPTRGILAALAAADAQAAAQPGPRGPSAPGAP